jgi:L-serine dehydratase
MTSPLPPNAFVSAFDLFTIGIGPSSSHTVGPMRAGADFVARLGSRVHGAHELEVELFGSLAATGDGHGTMPAVLLGLEGHRPDTITNETIRRRVALMDELGTVRLGGIADVPFRASDIRLSSHTVLPGHTNAVRFTLRRREGSTIDEAVYYSVGGGFIRREGETSAEPSHEPTPPFPFGSAAELLQQCTKGGISVAELTLRNECAFRSENEVRVGLKRVHDAMWQCIDAGLARDGVLPGKLRVAARAGKLRRRLMQHDPTPSIAYAQDWVNVVAIAVNEENAAGGRVVTAPTNGAAGIVPAVLFYALNFTQAGRVSSDETALRFLLTAAAIGSLYKARASISGAEVGCQGEVGSASSMAAAALAEVLGGTPAQVENAAEIAMEHNLGLTCDPVGGLVQIPCIERNALAANKAINAARIAMWGDGSHRVSLDVVIETMRQTGRDMSDKYKETSLGGLAVNVVEC